MTTFQIPAPDRFEFQMPGQNSKHSINSLLDLPEDKIASIVALSRVDVQDMEALKQFSDTLASLADDGDDDCVQAIRAMSIKQKIAFVQGYTEAAGVEPGESSAS